MTAVLDLTVADRTERDRYTGRVDVLDKVSALQLLPDDVHCTTPMVASFYEVTAEVIRKTVLRNREEFDSDGYIVMSPSDASDILSLTYSELGVSSKTSQMALFPRRAVLRIGMLLRDSLVAKKVRDYLLNAESGVQFRVPQTMADALRFAADEFERAELLAVQRDAAQAAVKALEPSATAYKTLIEDSGADFAIADACKILNRDPHIRDMGRQRLFTWMHQNNWCFRTGRRGRWTAYQSVVDRGWLVEAPGDRYFDDKAKEYRLSDPVIRVTAAGLAELRHRLSGRDKVLQLDFSV